MATFFCVVRSTASMTLKLRLKDLLCKSTFANLFEQLVLMVEQFSCAPEVGNSVHLN